MPGRSSPIPLDLYLTANSPGEISGWAAPLIGELRRALHSARVTIIIPPCQYASGGELELGLQAGADRCVKIGDFKKLVSDDLAVGGVPKKKLAVHLGGDVMFSVYASRKLKCPLWVYSSRPRWRFFTDRYFLPDKNAAWRFDKRGIRKGGYTAVGNMALDSAVPSESEAETREFLGVAPDVPVMTCLTGSRPIEYTEATRLMVAVSRIVTERFPELKVLFPLAPTVDEDALKSALSSAGAGWTGESRAREIELGGGRRASVVRGRTLESLNCSKLALAVPGTNNLQAAALCVPFIMVLPLDRADEYPLDGLAGLLPLGWPGVRRLKRAYIERLNARTACVSLPNRMAGRMIAPEIRGYFSPHVPAKMAIGLLESPERLMEISRAFRELTRERGAAARFAGEIAAFAGGKE